MISSACDVRDGGNPFGPFSFAKRSKETFLFIFIRLKHILPTFDIILGVEEKSWARVTNADVAI